jgi:hypothetical protein
MPVPPYFRVVDASVWENSWNSLYITHLLRCHANAGTSNRDGDPVAAVLLSSPFGEFVAQGGTKLIIGLAVMPIGRGKRWSNKRTLVKKKEDGNVMWDPRSEGRREHKGGDNDTKE